MSTTTPDSPSTTTLPPATGPTGADPHLFDRLSVLYKYRWATIAVFVLVVSWVMVDSYTRVPAYRAVARVLVEDPNADIATPSEIARNLPSGDPEMYMQTQLRIMKGRDLAQRVASKIDMTKVAEFNGQGPKPTQLAMTIAWIKYYAGWPYRIITSKTAEPPATAKSFTAVDASTVPDVLLARFNVAQIRGSQLVDMIFESADPQFAALAANTFANEYVTHNLELKVSTLNASADWLTGEVQKQGELVKESDLKLAQYKETQDAGALDSNQNIVVARLTATNDSAMKARMDRIAKEGLWRQIEAAGDDVESISSVLNNVSIQNLRVQLNALAQARSSATERYGERHPEYQKAVMAYNNAEAQLKEEIRKARNNARSEYENAVQQEREMTAQLGESKKQATALGRKGVDYAVLLREAESNHTIYNQLVTREKELRVVANSRTNNVRLVDKAEIPGEPFTPNHRRDWAYAIALGIALGLGLAFGIDYLDDTVKTPDDISRRLKLKFLGLVPIVSGDRHPLISGPVPHDFGEAYRSIRTALAAQLPGTGPRIVAVASSQPLEGKTTTAVNIAMALAVGGARVLLIDADMRRPSVHKALRMNNDRGLSQLLAGQARMREVVQRTHDPNLLTITAGRTPANPSELLASDRMRALLSGLETGPFDWIIIDTPPVLAVTDAVILAPLVAAVTFVIGAEMTRWRLAERAVETLLGSNPRNVLAVLNKVNFGRNKYYYSRYYGHQYKNYYAESPAA
ncbi:MAG: polysaccharide biosynthesis tyrosine autokinase [Cyanobacteria bacterium]|nr:polysaccharide biosynthesis tyrosine autokinase [Cyanobacteriota bacterium]